MIRQNKKSVLITLPSLKDIGGVASFYNNVLPYLYNSKEYSISFLEIGSTHGRKTFFYRVRDQIRFKKVLKDNPDLVFINPSLNLKSFIRDGLFVWQAKTKNIRVLIFFHGWDWNFVKRISRQNILKWFFKKTFAQASAFIVLASEFKQQLREWGIKVPIYLLTTAVDDNLLEGFDIEEKIKRIKKAKVINLLFLARIEREKGIFEVINAFNMLLSKNFPVHLSIAGNGSVLNELRNYVNSLGIKDKISFLGYVKGNYKAKVFAEHDIYCFPTYYGEGLPTSLLEAMAFGLPVITRPVGGIKDFFVNKKMGFITHSKSPDIIAELLEKLINNRDILIEISKYNYDYAKKYFLASVVAEKLIKIFEKI